MAIAERILTGTGARTSVNPGQVEVGRPRSDADGARRYRPILINFDARANMLSTIIEDTWELHLREVWSSNQSAVRMELLAEFGTVLGEDKIANFVAMGPEPWSIAFDHVVPLRQVRYSFAHGSFYPALVGACALGERIFNHLILALRDDYGGHSATTRRVRSDGTFTNWNAALDVLQGWGVLDGPTRALYDELMRLRHASVHFDPSVDAAVKGPALAAITTLQQIVGTIFAPLGGPPRFIPGVEGASYLARAAEEEPLIKRIFLPRSILVNPAHRLYPVADPVGGFTAIEDLDFPSTPLTDEEFAAALPAGIASMHPEFASGAEQNRE